MTISQLEYLLAVANYGSFSVAAEKCFVTQPSLSVQIKNLEDELGLVLLDRSTKPVIPTDAGMIVISQAREALSSFSRIKECATDFRGIIAGDLRIGCIPTIAPYIIHKIVPVINKKYPDVNLLVYERVTSDIINNLRKDQLDAGIIAEGFAPDYIREEYIAKDPFFVFVSPEHDLYKEKTVKVEQIRSEDLLLMTEGHCLRSQVLDLCSKNKDNIACSIECGSLETLIRVALAMRKITIIPEMSVPYIGGNLKNCIKPIASDRPAYRNITLATSRIFAKQRLIQVLKEELKSCFTEFPRF